MHYCVEQVNNCKYPYVVEQFLEKKLEDGLKLTGSFNPSAETVMFIFERLSVSADCQQTAT